MPNVLIVTVPAAKGADLVDMRDFVLESLELGVLILGQGASWQVEQLPELGGVEVREAVKAQGPSLPEPPAVGAAFTGYGAKEKRRILDALVQYRDRNGLGSLEALSQPDGPTLQELRAALLCEKLPMETWRKIGAALDQMGKG